MDIKINSILKIIKSVLIVHDQKDIDILFSDIAKARSPFIISFINAHAINLAYKSDAFAGALLASDIIFRDGIGMKLLYKALKVDGGLNMNGTDFIPLLLKKFKGEPMALIGTEEPYLSNVVQQLNSEGYNIVNSINGFCDFDVYLSLLKESKPRIVILGMGMPRQEIFARLVKESLSGDYILVNGGAIIDFLGGKVKRAPKWMQSAGIEWLYRFGNEPRRLFDRYIIGNAKFISRIPQIKKGYKQP